MDTPQTSRQPTSTVFIGNIPYDVSEEDLREHFRAIGPIKNLRLVSEKDTGKLKGYGFCEFYDLPTAQSAVSNLHKSEIKGRPLRVDFADEQSQSEGIKVKREKDTRLAPAVSGQAPGIKPMGAKLAQSAQVAGGAVLNRDLFYPSNSQDLLNEQLASCSSLRVYEMLSQLRTLHQQNPTAARQILLANPMLSKAMFQGLIMLGIVRPPMATPSEAPGGWGGGGGGGGGVERGGGGERGPPIPPPAPGPQMPPPFLPPVHGPPNQLAPPYIAGVPDGGVSYGGPVPPPAVPGGSMGGGMNRPPPPPPQQQQQLMGMGMPPPGVGQLEGPLGMGMNPPLSLQQHQQLQPQPQQLQPQPQQQHPPQMQMQMQQQQQQQQQQPQVQIGSYGMPPPPAQMMPPPPHMVMPSDAMVGGGPQGYPQHPHGHPQSMPPMGWSNEPGFQPPQRPPPQPQPNISQQPPPQQQQQQQPQPQLKQDNQGGGANATKSEEIIKKILSMTESEIEAIPDFQRDHVRKVRQYYQQRGRADKS